MIPRLQIGFSLKRQNVFLFGQEYTPHKGEYLLKYARTGIVMALQTTLPRGGRVGVVAYNCYTVANAIVQGGCTPVFIDVTPDLHINTDAIIGTQLDAIVVTNLFGIRNDIEQIRQALPNAIIIVDNAHGYGLPAEGDFTVYSINQGKFPSLGEGGVLWVNNIQYQDAIEQQCSQLKGYSLTAEIKLFISMLLKAWMHTPLIYGMITLPMKRNRKGGSCRERVVMKRMAKGVSRMYQAALRTIDEQIQQQRINAQQIADTLICKGLVEQIWYGENAFMLIARSDHPEQLSQYFTKNGVEVATHFVKTIEWAKQFGYTEGECPMAEKLTKELIMIPTYTKI